MPDPSGIRALIRGRVQMVGFRFFTQRAASRHRLRGWVRNCPDGSVEVEAVGERSDLQAFLEELGEGPPGSNVTRIDVEWLTAPSRHDDFHIRH